MFTFDEDSVESMSNFDFDIDYIKFKNQEMKPLIPTLLVACTQWRSSDRTEFQITDDLKIGHLTPGIYGDSNGIKCKEGIAYPIENMKIYSGLRGQELLFDSGKLKPIFFFDEDSEVYFNDCKYLNSLENLPRVGLVSLVNCDEFRENSCPIEVSQFTADCCQHLKSIKNVHIYKKEKHMRYEHSKMSFCNCRKLRNVEIESDNGSIDLIKIHACKDVNLSNKNVGYIQVLELSKTNFIHMKKFVENLSRISRFYITDALFSDISDLCELIEKSRQITIGGKTYYSQEEFWKHWPKEKLRKKYEYSAYNKIRRK